LFEASIPSSKSFGNKEVRYAMDANGNVHRAVSKYPPSATIAKVPSSKSLGGEQLHGTLILEISPQIGGVPKAVLDAANKAGVILRDSNRRIY
jgi:hypothetical protein